MLLVDDNLEDKVLEPVVGHEDVALVAALLAPAVLDPPAGDRAVRLNVTAGD